MSVVDRERVVIAEILRPRGLRGELIAISHTDVPGRLETVRRARVRLVNGADRPVELVSAWQHKGFWVLKFAGIDSLEQAEPFRGADLWVLPEERGKLREGEFFRSDLLGCQIVDRVSGEAQGIVEGWQQYGLGTPLMEVNRHGRQALVPFVGTLCKVDLAARTIVTEIPAGLWEL